MLQHQNFLPKILINLLFFFPLLPLISASNSTLHRRKLTRFTKDHNDNSICWDRHGADGFFSIIDAHNHFRPFGGPPVPFVTYLSWMRQHGIIFSTIFGIGQLIKKPHPDSPDCCYYLHCPTLDYPVVPDAYNDRKNAEDFKNYQNDDTLNNSIHLTLAISYPNLQSPGKDKQILDDLTAEFPGVFSWAGEINVFKHALAGNGFFRDGNRVTVAGINDGVFDDLFTILAKRKWPVTLHSDIGCDNYDKIPSTPPISAGCLVPPSELNLARKEHKFWQNLLGPHYPAFFDHKTNVPNPKNFKKIQHLHVFDALLSRYPDLNIIWAHMGLSLELHNLHPLIHVYIMKTLFDRHSNLYMDVSWDVLPKVHLMNHKSNTSIARLLAESHVDFDQDAAHLFNQQVVQDLRDELHQIFLSHKNSVHNTGSKKVITGPTYRMALYLDIFNQYSDRFMTGTDFVASTGAPDKYPGIRKYNNPPGGCMKDQTSHARQLTDTSSINMFLDDDAFRKIVLGENFFRLAAIDDTFAPPPICGHEGSSALSSATIAIIVTIVILLVIIAMAIIAFLIYRSRKTRHEVPRVPRTHRERDTLI